jgi:AI-2 transport protein TqsA
VGQGVARPFRPPRFRGRPDGFRIGSSVPGPPARQPVPRGVVVLLGMAGAVVAIAGMRATAGLLSPLLLALILTVTVSPVTGWLRRLGTPAWLAAVATVTILYLVLFLLGGALVLSLARLVDLVPTYQEELSNLRDDLLDGLSAAGVDPQPVRDLVGQLDAGSLGDLVNGAFDAVVGLMSNAVFLIAALLFMCLDAAHYPSRLATAARDRPQVVVALRTFAQGTRRYLWVTTVFGLIVAAFDTGMLWALGIPLPLLWGLLSFITNYIPNIGFVIGLIPPALLGLMEGGFDLCLKVIVLYCLVNFVIQSIIQPKIIGDAVGLSVTVSFVSLVFWTWVLGPLGALLAIPLSLLAKGLLVDIDPATRWVRPLISSDTGPAEPPPPARRGAGRG